ncbi:MAG: hypothetical protein Q8P18_26405 [Pseudomonadota bacterium]|nr:hypothetical protein [Pseudomonadota bacterium]
MILACLGAESVAAPALPSVAPGADVPTAPASLPRVDVPLPFDKPVPVLDGTARLKDARSSHTRDGRESSAGQLELERAGVTETVAFDANRPFQAWGRTMVVFGASGSYQLSVFPPGAPVVP